MTICHECGIREVEKKCRFCSECAENRRYFQLLIYRENWKKNNPEKYKSEYLKNNKKYRERIK